MLSEVINVYHHKSVGKLDLQDSWLLGILHLLDDVALQVVGRVVQTAVLSACIQSETPLLHCQVLLGKIVHSLLPAGVWSSLKSATAISQKNFW